MKKYAKDQEYRIRDLLRGRGWEAERVPISGAASAKRFKGDVQAEYGPVNLWVDHKSTRGTEQITLKRQAIQEIVKLAGDGDENFGIITFSFKGKHDLYAVVPLDELLSLLEEWAYAI